MFGAVIITLSFSLGQARITRNTQLLFNSNTKQALALINRYVFLQNLGDMMDCVWCMKKAQRDRFITPSLPPAPQELLMGVDFGLEDPNIG